MSVDLCRGCGGPWDDPFWHQCIASNAVPDARSGPTAGEIPVEAPETLTVCQIARGAFQDISRQQELRGVATYGETLQVDNGRDHFNDALEELADAWHYVTAARLREMALEQELARLRAALEREQRETARLRDEIGWDPEDPEDNADLLDSAP